MSGRMLVIACGTRNRAARLRVRYLLPVCQPLALTQRQSIFDVSTIERHQNQYTDININTPAAYCLSLLPSHAQTYALAVVAASAPTFYQALPHLALALAFASRSPSPAGTRSPHVRAARLSRQPRREPAPSFIRTYINAHVRADAAALINHRRRVVAQRLTVQIIRAQGPRQRGQAALLRHPLLSPPSPAREPLGLCRCVTSRRQLMDIGNARLPSDTLLHTTLTSLCGPQESVPVSTIVKSAGRCSLFSDLFIAFIRRCMLLLNLASIIVQLDLQ